MRKTLTRTRRAFARMMAAIDTLRPEGPTYAGHLPNQRQDRR